MLKKVEAHINQNLPFLHGKKILIACSGGLDSVVLAHIFTKLRFTIALAHCNFSLRGSESTADQTFVHKLAEKWNIPCYSGTFNTKTFSKTHKISTQMAARELRYSWFAQTATNLDYDYVLTAHHADDAMETFFINLSRGTGLRGLKGIPQTNGKVVRPLLPFTRADLLAFAKSENIFWREDSSNTSTQYTRNKLRLQVLPAYKQLTKNTVPNFQRSLHHLQQDHTLLEDYMVLIRKLVMREARVGYAIDVLKLKELPNTRALVFQLFQDFGFTDFNAIFELLSAQSGKQVVSKTHRLLKDRETLILTEVPKAENPSPKISIPKGTSQITEPVAITFQNAAGRTLTNAHTFFVDGDLLDFPLTLRKWSEGDWFQPFGMKGKKKLSKFLKDEKLSLAAKENIWLLCSGPTVVWVVGQRGDERFKVMPNTKNILKLTFSP